MAASRSKQPPVGSAGYVLDERQYSAQCVDENVEEFRYAVRNEMEWLNEHMSGILNASSFNLTETFKTPGKLRGRTPRTARKRNPLEERAVSIPNRRLMQLVLIMMQAINRRLCPYSKCAPEPSHQHGLLQASLKVQDR